MKVLHAASATILAALLLASPRASALDVSRQLWGQGGPSCQLSVPTTSSQVRPRATGMRNEGTTNQFVICQYAATSAMFTTAGMFVSSIDGANHTVQCTAMKGGADAPVYSTKQIDTGTSGFASLSWYPADFGTTTNFGNYLFSVTCTLPAGAAINSVYGYYTDYVGA